MKPRWPHSDRRGFLGQVGLAGIAVTSRAATPGTTPSPELRIGLLGAGERGQFLLRELLASAPRTQARVVAVCDVWQRNLHAAVQLLTQAQGTTPQSFTRFADLLARPEVDAVIIATPDFSHGTLLEASLAARKDVYIEKPMTIDLPSANRAVDLARQLGRVVQVGTQRRSEGRFRAAARFLASQPLGPISRVTAEVNFNQARWLRKLDDCVEADVDWKAFRLHLPDQPFDAALLRRWQLFRATSNGMPGLWMTHYADAVHFVTGARYPRAAVALGGTYIWRDGREHTDTFRTVLEYPEGFLFSWGMGLGNGAGTCFTLHGTLGTLDLEKWSVQAEPSAPASLAEPSFPAAGGESHMENWLKCVRSRQPTNAPIETGHQHVVATLMASQAMEFGRRMVYHPDRREISTG